VFGRSETHFDGAVRVADAVLEDVQLSRGDAPSLRRYSDA